MDIDKAFKKILVAFDNSESSKQAMQKACDIAEKFKSSITAIFVSGEGDKSFDDAKSFLQNFSTAKGIQVNIVQRNGKVYDEVIKLEKEEGFQLILIGAHGKQGWSPFWIGSNAFKVVSSSNCPVITIQDYATDTGISNIVLPLADSMTTRQKVPYAAVLAKACNATIHILGVSKGTGHEIEQRIHAYVRQTERYFQERDVQYTIEYKLGVKVPESIIEHAKKVNAGMLMIMTETESAGYFMDTYAQQLVNTSPVPVMSVHSRDTMVAGAAGY